MKHLDIPRQVVVGGREIDLIVGGDATSRGVVLFIHGLGLPDSMGIFPEQASIAQEQGYQTVQWMFPYIRPDGLYFPSAVEMGGIIDTIIGCIRDGNDDVRIVAVTHSNLGSLALVESNCEIDAAFLIAPAPEPLYWGLKAFFSTDPNTVIDEQGVSLLAQGPLSCMVEPDFWPSLKTSPFGSYEALTQCPTRFIISAEDVLTGSHGNYDQFIGAFGEFSSQLPGDHYFLPPNREALNAEFRDFIAALN